MEKILKDRLLKNKYVYTLICHGQRLFIMEATQDKTTMFISIASMPLNKHRTIIFDSKNDRTYSVNSRIPDSFWWNLGIYSNTTLYRIVLLFSEKKLDLKELIHACGKELLLEFYIHYLFPVSQTNNKINVSFWDEPLELATNYNFYDFNSAVYFHGNHDIIVEEQLPKLKSNLEMIPLIFAIQTDKQVGFVNLIKLGFKRVTCFKNSSNSYNLNLWIRTSTLNKKQRMRAKKKFFKKLDNNPIPNAYRKIAKEYARLYREQLNLTNSDPELIRTQITGIPSCCGGAVSWTDLFKLRPEDLTTRINIPTIINSYEKVVEIKALVKVEYLGKYYSDIYQKYLHYSILIPERKVADFTEITSTEHKSFLTTVKNRYVDAIIDFFYQYNPEQLDDLPEDWISVDVEYGDLYVTETARDALWDIVNELKEIKEIEKEIEILCKEL